jgi:hypothetical protein
MTQPRRANDSPHNRITQGPLRCRSAHRKRDDGDGTDRGRSWYETRGQAAAHPAVNGRQAHRAGAALADGAQPHQSARHAAMQKRR